MFTILDYSSALEYSIIRRYTNIVYYYYYYLPLIISYQKDEGCQETVCCRNSGHPTAKKGLLMHPEASMTDFCGL